MSQPYSAALPITYLVLRILIVLNWLMAAAILALLFVSPNMQSIMTAFELSPSPEAERLVMGLRAIAALGLAAIPLNYAVLKRLLAIVETVRGGDPFVAANASRLQAIAWALLALQLLSLVIGAIAKGRFDSGASARYRCRLFDLRLACRTLTFLLAWRVRGRHAHARRRRGDGVMAIAVKLDDLLYDRRMTLTELADQIEITLANLSILKTGKARAIRFSTLDAICEALACQPGDILRFEPEQAEGKRPAQGSKRSLKLDEHALERETAASLARRCRGHHRRVRALRHRAVRSGRRLDRPSGGSGRCRAHPSLVALLQPRSVVGKDRRGPADRARRRHDAALRTSVDRRRPGGRDVVRVAASRDRPAIPGRGGHPVPAILAPGSMGDDGRGDSPGQRRVGPRAHRRHQGGGEPAARMAMDADRGGATANRGPRRNATVTVSANGAPTNGFIVGKRGD